MDFDSFIHMGGYALHVWGSYGLALLGYGTLLVCALVKYEKLRKENRE